MTGGGWGLCNRKMVVSRFTGNTTKVWGVHEPNMARTKQLIDAARRLRVASRNSHKALWLYRI